MAIVKAASQGLNAANGTKSAVQAFKLASSGTWAFGATAWAYAVGGMGVAGAAMSTKGVYDQVKYAKHINEEIDVRKDTQSMTVQTQEIKDESVDNLDVAVENVGTVVEEVKTEDKTTDNTVVVNTETQKASTEEDDKKKKDEV